MPTVADAIVRHLQRAGTRALFGVPGGGGNLDLIAAAGRAGLPFVLTATETAAAIAAIAQSEVTGRPGACLTTLGPGAASVVNGVACAYLDRAPIVVFTDSYPEHVREQYEHQRLDHRALLAPVTKSSVTLDPAQIDDQMNTAIETAMEAVPGPVHLDCPGDVAGAPYADPGGVAHIWSDAFSSDALLALAEVMRARKPLLLVGQGARAEAPAIRAFCARRQVPAMVTYKGKGVVPDDHEWFAGVFTNGAIEKGFVGESDLLIGVGLDPVELLPRPWTYSAPIVYCGRWSVSESHVPFAAQTTATVAQGLRELESTLPSSEWRAADVRRHADRQRTAILIPTTGLSACTAVETCAATAGDGVRVTVDAGAHMLPATMLWPVTEPGGMLISNGLSTMGFALPAAIGAALLDRPRPVVALTGDGGLLMCAGELLTAVRERLRVIVVVFNDASLSLIEIKQQARQLQAAGVGLGKVSWRTLAEAFGVMAFEAANVSELQAAMQDALTSGGPALVDVKIDRSNYGAMLRAIRG